MGSAGLLSSGGPGTTTVAATGVSAAMAAVPGCGGAPKTWNEFQKANKGRGYPPAMMGQKWREYKADHGL